MKLRETLAGRVNCDQQLENRGLFYVWDKARAEGRGEHLSHRGSHTTIIAAVQSEQPRKGRLPGLHLGTQLLFNVLVAHPEVPQRG